MPEPTLYLFDGYNILHAGGRTDVRELVDELASFVAMSGARGVVVFDGVGEEHQVGPLSVRYAPDADTLLERLAAGHRHGERVCLVSSDEAIRGTSGQEVSNVSSATFLRASSPQRMSRIRRHACAIASIPRRARSSNASAAVNNRRARCRRGQMPGSALPHHDENGWLKPGTNTCSNHRAKFAKGL